MFFWMNRMMALAAFGVVTVFHQGSMALSVTSGEGDYRYSVTAALQFAGSSSHFVGFKVREDEPAVLVTDDGTGAVLTIEVRISQSGPTAVLSQWKVSFSRDGKSTTLGPNIEVPLGQPASVEMCFEPCGADERLKMHVTVNKVVE